MTLTTFTSFKYLGQVLTAADDDWVAVVGNLRKARKSWAGIEMILGWEGVRPRILGVFFKTVVQAVLLFGSETWLMTPLMVRALGIFQHRFYRWITGRQLKLQVDGSLGYPPLEAVVEEADFE